MMQSMLEILKPSTASAGTGGGGGSLRPSKFRGTADQDVDSWLDQFECYTDFSQFNGNRRLACLKALLDSPASTWLQMHEVNDYEELRILLHCYCHFKLV